MKFISRGPGGGDLDLEDLRLRARTEASSVGQEAQNRVRRVGYGVGVSGFIRLGTRRIYRISLDFRIRSIWSQNSRTQGIWI